MTHFGVKSDHVTVIFSTLFNGETESTNSSCKDSKTDERLAIVDRK